MLQEDLVGNSDECFAGIPADEHSLEESWEAERQNFS
jgi:hypothetical protein